MRVWNTVADWLQRREALTGTIGFVPTMGALHAGHASLVERCRAENDIVVVSIFVNPTQFNDPNDLARYPQTLDRDLELLESCGADEVILPSTAELYPHGYGLRADPGAATAIMEGAHRPGFLAGVLTIVWKLLNLVRADRVYFGEKDYQQLMAVTAMTEEFFFETKIVPCPTVREESGLAMSSRNLLLSAKGRIRAACLHSALTLAADTSEARAMLEREGFSVDYVEEHWGRRFAAASLEGVRLIDNVRLADHDSYR